MSLLPFIKEIVSVALDERAHEYPFGNLRPMNARRRADGDLGVGVDRVLHQVVDAGHVALHEPEIGGRGFGWGERRDGGDDGCALVGV